MSSPQVRDLSADTADTAEDIDDRPGPGTRRTVGLLAIALATSLIAQNAVLVAADAPSYGDPITEVLTWHADHRGAVTFAVGSEALNIPLLLALVTSLHTLLLRRGGRGTGWSRLAMAAGTTLTAVFALYTVLWNGVVLAADDLTAASAELALAWQMHAAAFALALPAVGTTLIGAALATHAGRLTPPWQRALAVTGGSLLIVAGLANLAIADGSTLLLIGMPGYAVWLIWLLATGTRLLRTSTGDPDEPAPGRPASGEPAGQDN